MAMPFLLERLEAAEAELARWIAAGKSLEMSDELSDLCLLAALAGEYRGAIGASDSGILADLERRARVALLPKTDDDRAGAMLVFPHENRLAEELKLMYTGFAEALHCAAASVHFSDGFEGLCIRKGDLHFAVYQRLKNETGVHASGEDCCAVTALPLRGDVSADGYSFEAFAHPDDHRFHRFRSCVKVSRDGLSCESLSLRSAVQNRDLALSALAARLEHSDHVYNLIRSYDFSDGTLSDLRLGKCFSIDDPLPLFESLLLAE